MDTIYKGLVSPRSQVAAGRPDIPEEDRPGAILVDLVKDAAKAGFDRPEQEEFKGPGAVEPASPHIRRDNEPSSDYEVELNG